jgi:hypothetical protein
MTEGFFHVAETVEQLRAIAAAIDSTWRNLDIRTTSAHVVMALDEAGSSLHRAMIALSGLEAATPELDTGAESHQHFSPTTPVPG